MPNRIRFGADFDDKVSGKLAKLRDNFDRMGKSSGFKALAQGVGLGIGAAAFNLVGDAAHAAADFIGDSIDAASDMNESLSKSRVIFGSAAGSIESFGDTAATSLGISKRSAVEAAATFGNLFTGLGKGQGEAAAMSKNLVALASDLASFNNLDPTDVLEKLRAGLAGEAEPLRSVGVFLNEAKVKAKAMELGLADANGEISDGAKITARYNLILQETTTAQGDFARTADGLANSQRSANAQLEDAQAALGQQLLPAQLEVTKAQINLFTSLEAFGDILGGRVTPETIAMSVALGKMNEEQARAAIEALNHKTALEFMAGAVKDDTVAVKGLTESQRRAMEATEEFSKDLRTSKQRSDDLRESMVDTANTIIEQYYGPIETRRAIADAKDEESAARKKLREKGITNAEKRELQARVGNAQKQQDQLQLHLLETGEMTTTETKKYFSSLETRIRNSTGDGRRYLQELRREALKINNLKLYLNFVARVRSQGVGSVVHGQHGAVVPPGGTAIVGETAQETVQFFPGGGGVVIPDGPERTGGGATQVIQLVVDGRVLAEVVDAHQYRALQRSVPTARRV